MQGIRLSLLTLFISSAVQYSIACSGYKVTVGTKSILGSNEDAWRVTPHIWFETGKAKGNYGAAFTGSRFDGENGYAPQAGMNDMGLAFERLASYHPLKENFTNRKTIINPTQYLKHILHTCKSIEEVRAYISEYDQSYFIEDVFIYVEKSGKYLIVEPYTMTMGNKPAYVISNFCPSITTEEEASKLARYNNGIAFLNNKIDTSLDFCTALSDTMHVCRKKIGDGTLLTSIWDLSEGKVNLYFYHDYSHTVAFDINQELGKGDHIMAIDSLFPQNSEFEALRHYKTPKNSHLIGVFIVAAGALFLVTALFFLVMYFRRPGSQQNSYLNLCLFSLGMVMFYYMYVLSGSINVFYFPAPFKDPENVFVSASSYIPFLIAILIIPLCIQNVNLFRQKKESIWTKGLFTLNNFAYIALIRLFDYWGFYGVFG